jgi:hypothetical protein
MGTAVAVLSSPCTHKTTTPIKHVQYTSVSYCGLVRWHTELRVQQFNYLILQTSWFDVQHEVAVQITYKR